MASDERDGEIQAAARHLLAGNLVAFPTETVYGLGADAANSGALTKVFRAKRRPVDHPLIVHLAGADALGQWAGEIPQSAWDLAEFCWPGPLTLILSKRPTVPEMLTGAQPTVGLRVPSHPLALDLLTTFSRLKADHGEPGEAGSQPAPQGLAAPSANLFGRTSPTTAEHVRSEFCTNTSTAFQPWVLDGGACSVGIESTILDLSGECARILRPGYFDALTLAKVLGKTPQTGSEPGKSPRVPGALTMHYAPQTPASLLTMPEILKLCREKHGKLGVLTCGVPRTGALPEPGHVTWRSLPSEAGAYARSLYATLRELDAGACTRILVEHPPETPEWLAVRDRLQRACADLV